MNETKLSPNVQEAKDIVANLATSIGVVENWSTSKAESTINGLFDDWEKLCKETESAKSRIFCEQCEEILQRCTSFQNTIAAKSDSFKAEVELELKDILDKVGDDNETIKSLLEQIIGPGWNDLVRPRLLFLYKASVELETSIRNMIEFAMSTQKLN